MIIYEYPFNERMRTMLRLEDLHNQYAFFLQQDEPMQHHIALITMFEMLDVATRTDAKMDVLQELGRLKQILLEKQRQAKDGKQTEITEFLNEIAKVRDSLGNMYGKPGQNIRDNEWLMGLRGRMVIPGGVCEFDVPGYHAWRHKSAQARREDIISWASSLQILADAIKLFLRILRTCGTPFEVKAHHGMYQEMLSGKSLRLLRLEVDAGDAIIPDVSVNKYMVIIRFNKQESLLEKPQLVDDDISCKCTLCKL